MTSRSVSPRTAPPPRQKSPLVLGRLGLPRRTSGQVYRFVGTVWALVAEAHDGTVGAMASKRIRSAALALAEALRAQTRLARAEAGEIELTEEQTMGWSDRVGRNHDRCDRILATLGIDRRDVDPWDAILRPTPAATSRPAAANGAGKATDGPDATNAAGATPGG